MPSTFAIMEDKKTNDYPAIVIEERQDTVKPRPMKKYVIIGVISILAVAIVLTAILVGMYMFTEAQKDILKYTLSLGNNAKQDVTSDPNTNIVQYHVSNPGQESWIVNDFNRDIQVVKIQNSKGTNCYVSALNRSIAMDPSKITKPEDTSDIKIGGSLIYVTSNTPVSDTSFLSKTARDTCAGISVYWVYPQCRDEIVGNPNITDVDKSQRKKRYVDNSPYYYYFVGYYSGHPVDCYTGCCETICACSISYYWSYSNGYIYCTWYRYNCPAYGIYATVYDRYCYGPSGVVCPSYYSACPKYLWL